MYTRNYYISQSINQYDKKKIIEKTIKSRRIAKLDADESDEADKLEAEEEEEEDLDSWD